MLLFPCASDLVQALADLDPVARQVTLAWEPPEFILLQASMVKQEMCVTHRFQMHLQNSSFSEIPVAKIGPLTLPDCSCCLVEKKIIPKPHCSKTKLFEVCTFNVGSLLEKIKPIHSQLAQLSATLCPDSALQTILFSFSSQPKASLIETKNNSTTPTFVQRCVARMESADPEPSESQVSHFFETTGWKQSVASFLENSTLSCAPFRVTEPWLTLSKFIFPYHYDPPSPKHKPTISTAKFENCRMCQRMRHGTDPEFQLDLIHKWQRKYEEDLSQGEICYPLAPSILATVRTVTQHLQTLVDGVTPATTCTCEVVRQKQAEVECVFLWPALQQFLRELQLSAPTVTFSFESDPEKKVLLFTEGDSGRQRFIHEEKVDEAISSDTTSSLLPFYLLKTCPQMFHIDLPLRQVCLFPKLLTSPQNPYIHPPYITLSMRCDQDPLQLSFEQDRTIFQLMFPLHKLQQACLTSDVSEESAPETSR